MDQKDEIKSKIDLVEFIREYVPLRAVGVNFTARCPFHQEKTPSFVVSPERQIWKCFGCGKGGDVFSFIMEMEGLSFVEALRELAPKAGVTLRRQNAREASQRNRLLDCTELAVSYYHRILLESPQAQPARDYLTRRGLSEQTIEEFKIGYSFDSWDGLYLMLRKKGFTDADIFLAGLTVKKDKGLGYYDRFRGRIMFPIFDVNGNELGFSARVSPEREATEKMGKYINSPQTQIYDKSSVLFGLDKAKHAIRQEDAAIVVEGQMDVISSHQAGFKNVVASSGTALSANQVKMIKRYTNNILFSFDVDVAGVSAANRQIEEGKVQEVVRNARIVDGEDRLGRTHKYIYPAMSQEVNIKVIQVPGGKDPDECIRHNPDDFRQAIKSAQSIIDYYFSQIFNGLDTNKVENKKQAAAKILSVVTHIASSIEQDTWLRRLSEVLFVHEDSLREILRRRYRERRPMRKSDSPAAQTSRRASQNQAEVLTDSLLALMLKFFTYFEQAVRMVTPEMLAGALRQTFYKMLVIYYNSNSHHRDVFESSHFNAWLAHNIKDEQDLVSLAELADTLLLLADKDFYDLEPAAARAQLQHIAAHLKRQQLSVRLLQLEQALAAAERGGGREATEHLLAQCAAVNNEIKSLTVQ
ncbi:DNA primase [Candidatus Falkowbacteria bacterium RIFOXYC2_FULL_47_12]|uniref:DNA primase n=2 Tax=Candidatus Falkowiibacteriota TaxID=1752728 RepID=A0A1F5TSV4_9BACT|nr:MAG: DNA primase [Candidatus Falkowbacteria bacterium RIFOXYA2_FULL_47_9]OGF41661.1 MAG: DNA primase [Candidatus Falkowbacteria bacterium RIFOXYC2_FULL_47_12]